MHRRNEVTLELRCLGDARVFLNGEALFLTKRQLETLVLFALHPEGLSGAQIAQGLYGDAHKNIKSLLSRLRQTIPLQSRPYGLYPSVKADFLELRQVVAKGELSSAASLYQGALLPWSDAPAIVQERSFLESSLSEAALHTQNTEALFQLSSTIGDDLALWERLTDELTPGDPRHNLSEARVKHIQAQWQI